ncbi:hypothetical protein Mal52_29900 [Symmachiella dynata]|uniref:Uncharacterized protein n=1 Tax=Symmachiella dynata TaxID=2527995 RepID=A0A517ZPZ5_9PLAN|nr:hypothetical protein Mal52_29900 [Symmachiella dynata]
MISKNTALLSITLCLCAPGLCQAAEMYSSGPYTHSMAVNSPFAIGGTTRKALPPLDCLRCSGPRPCPPHCCHGGGFLYYGTDAHSDNCFNKMNDCPNGCCGDHAIRFSRTWIIRGRR